MTPSPTALGQANLRSAAAEGYEGPATLGGTVGGIRQVKIKSGPNAGRLMGRFVLDDGLPRFALRLRRLRRGRRSPGPPAPWSGTSAAAADDR